MYALVSNGIVTNSNLSLNIWRSEHPQISLPAFPTEEQLNEQGIYTVEPAPQPSIDHTQSAESSVVFNGTSCVQEWSVSDASEEEIASRTASQSKAVRDDRNQRLTNCDWTQLPDAPVNTESWSEYRQALRDIPEQANFPWDIIWPDEPAA